MVRRNRLSEEPKPQDYENRQSWKARPKTAFLIRVLLFVVPIVGGISTTMLLGRAFFRPTWSLPVRLLWIAAMFVVASKVSGKLARLCDRFLPLAALCQLNLRFPKEAPSRIADRNRIVYPGISSTSRAHVRAGEGSSDDEGEIGLSARVMTPKSVLLLAIPGQPGANANVFNGEFESNLIRGVLEATETVWTIAGVRGANGSAGDGGPATDAKLREITDLALDRISGYLLDHGPTPTIRVLR